MMFGRRRAPLKMDDALATAERRITAAERNEAEAIEMRDKALEIADWAKGELVKQRVEMQEQHNARHEIIKFEVDKALTRVKEDATKAERQRLQAFVLNRDYRMPRETRRMLLEALLA